MTRLVVDALVAGRDAFHVGPLSLEAGRGALIALIGPNGGGKTTLLKTVAGLIPPRTGSVQIETGDQAEAGRPAVAYLPPPGGVVAAFSVLHLTALGRAGRRRWSPALSPADLDAARVALDDLGVADLAARPFDHLSSGQQQLVLLARLKVQDAAVCLLDEPLALLDPANAATVERAIAALTAGGHIVIASTHSLAFAARCDRVIAVGPDGVTVSPPGEALTADRLAALYGLAPETWRNARPDL